MWACSSGCRYFDWSITVPLQMAEYHLILSAVQPSIGVSRFWRLLVGTVVMLAADYPVRLTL